MQKDHVIGHSKILDFFDRVIQQGNLSHAYCFIGPEHVGKKRVADVLAAELLGTSLEKLYTCPDYTLIKQELNEKTGKTKKHIDIEQIRTLREAMSRYAFGGGYKVAIIDGAEKMNASSANGLLKTLEEPKQKTILLLLTTDDEKIPATILSRCQTIYFHPVAKEVLIAQSIPEEIIKQANGLPGLALTWQEDTEVFTAHKAEQTRFESMIGKPFGDKLQVVEELFGDKTDHMAARGKLQDILNIWEISLRTTLTDKEKMKQWSEEQILHVFQNITQARERLQQNIHPRLLIEHILLYIP